MQLHNTIGTRLAVRMSRVSNMHCGSESPCRALLLIGFPPQVWVVGELHDDKKLHWRADSDSELTKASVLRFPLSFCLAQHPLV